MFITLRDQPVSIKDKGPLKKALTKVEALEQGLKKGYELLNKALNIDRNPLNKALNKFKHNHLKRPYTG